MKRIVVASIVAVLVVVGAIVFWPTSSSGPVPIDYGKDSCAQCKMVLSQPGFAAELLDASGNLTKYDDLGCMLLDVWAGGKVSGWVEDHTSHELVTLGAATFVHLPSLSTPMGHGLVAFANRAEAERFAGEHGGSAMSLEQVASLRSTIAARGAQGAGSPDERTVAHLDLQAANEVYVRECSACHGERGRGDGPARDWVDPKPRDFTRAQFKLRTTPNGVPPTTEDVLRVIERGIPGTAMPAFDFLGEDERRLAAARVLAFAGLLEQPEPDPIADPGAPSPATPASIARGEQLYAELGCASCHGPKGRGDGPSAAFQQDDQGLPVAPRDFTSGVFRGGSDRRDLYYRFVTGMDGSPMPSYGSSIESEADRWALVDFVMSLQQPVPPPSYPADPIAAGRQLAQNYDCRGCHVLDDGRGGDVGPDLRISGQKLSSDWVRDFLQAPREAGKIYPWRPQRMPHLGLSREEADIGARYLAAMGRRTTEPLTLPDPGTFPEDQLAAGKGIFLVRCTECHSLGTVIETPPIKRQGPDLINVARRVDFEWAEHWIADPKQIDAKTRMTNPGITAAEVEAVRMFVWKTALEQGPMDDLGQPALGLASSEPAQ